VDGGRVLVQGVTNMNAITVMVNERAVDQTMNETIYSHNSIISALYM
jgi:hypothetical protein